MNGQLRPEPRSYSCSYVKTRLSSFSLCKFCRKFIKGKRKLVQSSDHNEGRDADRKEHYSSYESWAELINGMQLTEEECRNKVLQKSPKLNQKVYKDWMELIYRIQSIVEENASEVLKDSTELKSNQTIYISLKHWKKLISGTGMTAVKNKDVEMKKSDPIDYLSYKRWRKLTKGTQLTAIKHEDKEMKRSDCFQPTNQTVYLSQKHWRKLISGTQLKAEEAEEAERQENEKVKSSAKMKCDNNGEENLNLICWNNIEIAPDLNEKHFLKSVPPDIFKKVFKKDNPTVSNDGPTSANPKTEVQMRWDAVKTSLGFPERRVFLNERRPIPIELGNILINETCDQNSINKINETHAQKFFGKNF